VVIPQLIGTFHRGFFCDDASIRYPYKADTITNTNLFLYAIFVIILTVSFRFSFFFVSEEKVSQRLNPEEQVRNLASTNHINVLKHEQLTEKSFDSIIIGYAQIGAVSLYVIINLTKITVGRLRPHFLDVCKPKDLVCKKYYRYITNYVCTGDEDLVLEARKSFFSGHSAIAMYSSTFAAVSLIQREESPKLARQIAISNGCETVASRHRHREKTEAQIGDNSSENKAPLLLPLISNEESAAIKRCLTRAGLENSVKVIEIPSDTQDAS
uniref:AcidPPc domain-containing protein n=1 Tax=Angiostrongylus cantonensis TaxID=6313 RepID=A0A0K0D1H3_ANGCA